MWIHSRCTSIRNHNDIIIHITFFSRRLFFVLVLWVSVGRFAADTLTLTRRNHTKNACEDSKSDRCTIKKAHNKRHFQTISFHRTRNFHAARGKNGDFLQFSPIFYCLSPSRLFPTRCPCVRQICMCLLISARFFLAFVVSDYYYCHLIS